MKKNIPFLALLLGAGSASAATLASYSFSSNTNSAATDPGVTASSFSSTGPFVSGGSSSAGRSTAGNYFLRGLSGPFDKDASYATFTVTPIGSATFSLETLTFNYGGHMPSSADFSEFTATYAVRSSIDGYAADIPVTYAVNPYVIPDTNDNTAQLSASFTFSGAEYEDLAAPVTFRFYATAVYPDPALPEDPAADPFDAIVRFDSVILSGAVPEPSAALLGALGSLLILRRKR